MKKLGVIGGMGPEASAYFYHLFTTRTNAAADQEHPDAIILSLPSTPDRTAFITGKSTDSPVHALQNAAKTLEQLGADCIAIPCVTSHFFYDDVAACVSIPVFHILRETASIMQQRGVTRAGILGTAGTLTSGFVPPILAEYGITALTPDAAGVDTLSRLIYGILKTDRKGDCMSLLTDILQSPSLSGAETLVLACTELSLLNRDCKLGDAFIDPLEILADRALAFCKPAL